MSARKGERYTVGKIETIRKLAGEKRTDREIAKALGRPDQSVVGRIRRRERIRRSEGIPSGERRRYTPAKDAAIREAGGSSREIAAQVGRTASAVQNRRRTEFVDAPRRGPA